MDGALLAALLGVVFGIIACTLACIVCRIWRRNRYYKKVQHSLDEEERAFQETLSRSYQDDGTEYDGEDKEKLQMLETYMQSIEYAAERGAAEGEDDGEQLPSRAEDVDKFMQELAAAASGGGKIPPVAEPPSGGS